ncbi:transmembrane protein 70, mitochondrial [Scomber scombrus]|uniref:transmembrane protein 70, mitochondrial n=1 Tax=Scomber scombrus TaxID=13677 RepID=UPI002DDAE9BD|nr:transmembrane protein 70, mitochondrial [Scomber scombrus]
MFSVNMIRRLRPRAVSHSFSYYHVMASRHAASRSACSLRGLSGELPRADRSSLCVRYTLQSGCPSSRCLSTTSHSEEGNLIYTGSLGSAVRGVKMFSYTTSGASLFLMPQILFKTGVGVQSVALQAAFCGVIGFFTFLTPVLLHVITKGYVIRLYHNPDTDTYTAVTYSVFLTEKKTVFHQKEVRIPAVSKMFTTFYADKAGLLVNPDLFLLSQDYNHLMGYDKPFSFHSDDIDRPES